MLVWTEGVSQAKVNNALSVVVVSNSEQKDPWISRVKGEHSRIHVRPQSLAAKTRSLALSMDASWTRWLTLLFLADVAH